ncbi:hypothetical protein CEXT_646371 [Caerostris extrusa]|uniref:Uncharacterized protein n=1 Tax=Caerostris extrusa TaxID=172846 RepID=A0AAV4M989_CAEEX|nr:hypothetical protein CEXT_646371 [Caerostris extrusa]
MDYKATRSRQGWPTSYSPTISRRFQLVTDLYNVLTRTARIARETWDIRCPIERYHNNVLDELTHMWTLIHLKYNYCCPNYQYLNEMGLVCISNSYNNNIPSIGTICG